MVCGGWNFKLERNEMDELKGEKVRWRGLLVCHKL